MKLSIWVTRRCNMKCSYCYEDGMAREDGNNCDEKEYIDKVIDFINVNCQKTSSKKLFIKFFGGEPLLKFDFVKRFLKNLDENVNKEIKIYYSITTNGTLMNNVDTINWFRDNNVECALSIDGDERTYVANRVLKNGDSPWEIIDALIPRLVDSKINLTGRMTYNSKTVDNLFNNCMYLLNRGFRMLKAVPDFFDENWTVEKIAILEREVSKIYKLLKSDSTIHINLDDDDLLIGRKGCAGGYSMFSIDRDGGIYPCTYVVEDKNYLIGNIFNDVHIPLGYTEGGNIIRKDCEGCKYYICCKSAGCLYGNYKMTGSMSKVNTFFCEYQKLLYRLMGV